METLIHKPDGTLESTIPWREGRKVRRKSIEVHQIPAGTIGTVLNNHSYQVSSSAYIQIDWGVYGKKATEIRVMEFVDGDIDT